MRSPVQAIAQAADAGGVEVRIGPTNDRGWSFVVSMADDDGADLAVAQPVGWLPADADQVALAEDWERDEVHLAVNGNRTSAMATWQGGALSPDQSPIALVAAQLADLFEVGDRCTELERVLNREIEDEDTLLESLGEILPLPEHDETADSSLVAFHGKADVAKLAAAIAGPADLIEVSDGWWCLDVDDHEEGVLEMAFGLSGAARRRDTVLLLERGKGTFSWSLIRRGIPEASGHWNDRWRYAGPRNHDDDRENAHALARRLAPHTRSGIDESLLRALMRRPGPAYLVMVEFADIVGLPREVISILDRGAHTIPKNRVLRIERTTPLRAALTQARAQGDLTDSRPRRALALAYAIATAIAALVTLAMTGLTVAVLATDGEIVDDLGAGSEAWPWILVFAGLSGLLVPTAVRRLRRTLGRG